MEGCKWGVYNSENTNKFAIQQFNWILSNSLESSFPSVNNSYKMETML